MGHSIKLDSESLLFVQKLQLEYVALLGPKKRFQEIRRLINLKKKDLRNPVLGPAGLNIGGSVPTPVPLISTENGSIRMFENPSSLNFATPQSRALASALVPASRGPTSVVKLFTTSNPIVLLSP